MKTHIVRAPATDRYIIQVPTTLADLGYVPPVIPTLPPVVTTKRHAKLTQLYESGSTHTFDLDTTDENIGGGSWTGPAWMPKTAGLYLVVFSWMPDYTAYAQRDWQLDLLVNAAITQTFHQTMDAGPNHCHQVTTSQRLSDSDELRFDAVQTSGAGIDVLWSEAQMFYMAP
jgi:hypothetical protein